jgi:penicillin-binding protein 1C
MRKRRLLLRGAALLLIGALAAEVALRLTPLPETLTSAPPVSTEFLDREGRPLRALLAEEKRYARRTRLAEISPALVDATLSAEDRRFFRHHGIDVRASCRAVWQAIRGRELRSGASTITQQLVKLAEPRPRTAARKLREIWLALRLERSWSKERILEEYLNRLPYGNLQVGIGSAARYYFGKPAADLSAAEAAFLAALPNAPGRLDPHTNFAGAQQRQQWILRQMQRHGQLEPGACEAALIEPLTLRSRAATSPLRTSSICCCKGAGCFPQQAGRSARRSICRCNSASSRASASSSRASWRRTPPPQPQWCSTTPPARCWRSPARVITSRLEPVR